MAIIDGVRLIVVIKGKELRGNCILNIKNSQTVQENYVIIVNYKGILLAK